MVDMTRQPTSSASAQTRRSILFFIGTSSFLRFLQGVDQFIIKRNHAKINIFSLFGGLHKFTERFLCTIPKAVNVRVFCGTENPSPTSVHYIGGRLAGWGVEIATPVTSVTGSQ
jgi:hypothetical protein